MGTTASPNADAVLDLVSTTRGVLLPRMSTTQQNAIISIPEGLRIYDLTKHFPAYYNGTAWLNVGSLTGIETLTNKTIDGGSNTLINLPAANLSGTIPIAHGGTGQITAQLGLNALAGSVTSTQYLRGNGTNILMSTIQIADVPVLNQNTSGTAAGLSATLAISSGGTGLTSTSQNFAFIGPTSGAGAPTWRAIVAGDIPVLNQNTTGAAAALSATLVVGSGGLGAANPTVHGVLLGQGTSAVTSSVGGAGTLHQGNGSSSDPSWTATPTLGVNATTGGTLSLATATGSGQSVTMQNLGTTTAYNFNLPSTPGSAGSVLTSQGGGSTSMTWGTALSNPMTTAGDLIIGGVSGAATRLAAGTASFVLQSNGAGNETWVAPAQHQSAYLTSGTSWTSPAGVTSSTIFKITLVGGGGGGGGSLGTFAATGGGGSGGMTMAFVSGLAASTGYTIAIGAGGSGGAATPAAGGTGGNTTISINSTTYTANGAAATPSSSGSGVNFSSGGAGGTASSVNGTIFQAGDPGQPAVNLASTFPGAGNGGRSPFGGGGGVAGLAPAGGGSGTGGAGGGAGAGGGGSASGSASVGKVGGAGVNGAILIEWNQ